MGGRSHWRPSRRPVTEGRVNGEQRGETLVIVPTYNEGENLPTLIPKILDASHELDVLVVDDASPDGTAEAAMRVGDRFPGRVHVLRREGKGGLGPAYLDGFRWALARPYERICGMDADLSHPPRMLTEMVRVSRQDGVDFVIGSRYKEGRVTVVNWPIGRLLVSLFGNLYARAITGLPSSDATGGFNLFNRRVIEALDLTRIESTGYAFQIELKLRAWSKGFRFVEVPIIFTERDHGVSKMSKRIVFEAVWRVWKLRLLRLMRRL